PFPFPLFNCAGSNFLFQFKAIVSFLKVAVKYRLLMKQRYWAPKLHSFGEVNQVRLHLTYI
ncbi:hypothetical protein, partial [Enterobacter hormaechei]|uniref:hypothetical protein n=1 Tax=Enterobacter hormaechei TaxID=158836 RepID=UPI001C52D5A8